MANQKFGHFFVPDNSIGGGEFSVICLSQVGRPAWRDRVGKIHQSSLKDTCCPFSKWLSPPKKRKTTIDKAMFRCIM